MATKKAVGRPPKYKCKEEIEEKIEAYFKKCEGRVLEDKNGDPILDKWGKPIIVEREVPTITGLALALGFSTRLSLLNYQGKVEFMNTITRAKTRVEAYTEQRLFDRDGSNGAQFSLRNNFKGWNDKQITVLDEEEQKARIEQIKAKTEQIKNNDNDDGEDGVVIVNDAPKDIGYSDTEIPSDIQQQDN